jgi:hypothetical protein
MMRRDWVQPPLPLYGLPDYYYRRIVAPAWPGAKVGPGPRCRFCLVLLNSEEWVLERCLAHWSADILDCPATEASLASFVLD